VQYRIRSTAKWFDLDDVREALRTGTSGLGDGPSEEYKEGGLRLPPQHRRY
jgi:NAD+ diphosphatase